jgi:cytochrome P450
MDLESPVCDAPLEESKKISIYVDDLLKQVRLPDSQAVIPIVKTEELPNKKQVCHMIADPELQKLFEEPHRYGPGPSQQTHASQHLYAAEAIRKRAQAVFSKPNPLTAYQQESEKIRSHLISFFHVKTIKHLEQTWFTIADEWTNEMLSRGKVSLFESASQLVARFLIEGILGYRPCQKDDIDLNVTLWKKLLTPSPDRFHHLETLQKQRTTFEKMVNKLLEGQDLAAKVKTYLWDLSQLHQKVRAIIAFGCSEEGRLNPNICAFLADREIDSDLLEGTIGMLMIAGQETTSYLLGYLLYEYAAHPDLLKEHAADLDVIMQKRDDQSRLSDQLKGSLCHTAYLEGLRMYPTGGAARQLAVDVTVKCPVEAQKLGMPEEYHIRKGEWINCIPYLAGHDGSRWKDPETFNPHRPHLDQVKSLVLPFGSGAHRCPGEKAAETEILIALAAVLSKAILEKVQDLPPLIDASVLRPERDIDVIFKKR